MSDLAKLLTVPVVPLGSIVLFPQGRLSLDVAGPAWAVLAADRKAGRSEPVLAVAEVEGNVAQVGTLATLERLTKLPQGGFRAVLLGLSRHRLHAVTQLAPLVRGQIEPLVETPSADDERAALAPQLEELREATQLLLDEAPELGQGVRVALGGAEDAGLAADVLGAMLEMPLTTRIALLTEPDAAKRVALALETVRTLATRTRETRPDPAVREEVLREKMRAIQAELGEETSDDEATDALAAKVRAADLPPEARAVADKQLRRLRGMNEQSPETSGVRAYVELIAELPWRKRSEDHLELDRVRAVLEEEHAGLKKMKRRIIEHVAVMRLNPDKKAPILCLVGPPGVGKTSLGKAIAKALGREYVRVSLGGVRDESEIRGHRRTYVGALPGRIIQALRRAGTKNPVFVLDEIDKLGGDGRGDPSSALLEVLDPAQNDTFSDNFLEIPFDLSEVLFVTTANDLGTIPWALRDRMEVLELTGYTAVEKRSIARAHLVPRQLLEHGLAADRVIFQDAALDEVIEGHTHEAGVRGLERQLATVVRGLTVRVASGEEIDAEVTPDEVTRALGPARFEPPSAIAIDQEGVATGLAWTGAGGDVLVLEATKMTGKGKLTLTGQLGDVMRESATAAHSWVRAHAAELGISETTIATHDLHVHAPEGGVPKDGPSAGVTLVAALASVLSGRRVRGDVAMTGEVTLRGHVLPVGGIAEKVIAAHRAGLRTVILPTRNAKDVAELPADVVRDVTLVYVDRVQQVLDRVLEPRIVLPVPIPARHRHTPLAA